MVKKTTCSTPACERIEMYTGQGLCKKCYQRRWYQVEKQSRVGEVVQLEMTIKAMAENAIDKARQAFEKEEGETFKYKNRVQVLRSKLNVALTISRT